MQDIVRAAGTKRVRGERKVFKVGNGEGKAEMRKAEKGVGGVEAGKVEGLRRRSRMSELRGGLRYGSRVAADHTNLREKCQ